MTAAERLHSVNEYYFSKKLKEVSALQEQGKPIINLGIGSPDLAPPAEVVTALQEAISNPNAHQYQSYNGLPELRNAMAEFYRTQYQVNLDAATEILPLLGSKEGVMHISLAFLNAGDKVLIPNPGYPTYASVTKLLGAQPVFYDLNEDNNWFPDLNQLSKQNLDKVKLMWINYPHMPTGAKATLKQFKELISFAEAHNILLINDNPYSFILNNNPQSILQVENAFNVAIELNSLSKTFNMAGWRVGMVLGNSNFIRQITKVKSNIDSGMFYGVQKGAVKALQSAPAWYNTLNSVYANRKKLIHQLAQKLNCTFASNTAGLFVWAKLPSNSFSSEDFVDDLLYTKSLFVAPGTVFGDQGEGYIRFSLCVPENKIIEALNRV